MKYDGQEWSSSLKLLVVLSSMCNRKAFPLSAITSLVYSNKRLLISLLKLLERYPVLYTLHFLLLFKWNPSNWFHLVTYTVITPAVQLVRGVAGRDELSAHSVLKFMNNSHLHNSVLMFFYLHIGWCEQITLTLAYICEDSHRLWRSVKRKHLLTCKLVNVKANIQRMLLSQSFLIFFWDFFFSRF